MKRPLFVGLLCSLTFMFFVAFTPLMPAVQAQAKPPITRADYGQWETLAAGGGRGGGGGGFSPDGQWVAYGINRSSRSNELRVTKIADGTTKTAAFGTQQVFSSDSKWLAYSVGQSEAEQERLRAANRPVQSSLGLLNLATGAQATVEGIESFAFSEDGRYLAMRRYPPAPPAAGREGGAAPAGGGRGGRGGGGGAGAAEEGTPGATLTMRDLSTGRDTTFGNVAEFDWQDAEHGHLLAMTINAEGKLGNGVQLFDPQTTVLRVLDSSPSIYAGLSWRKDTTDLAVLRAQTDDKHDGSTSTVLAWTQLDSGEQLHTYDPMKDSAFPAGMRTVSFRRPSWSDDGRMIFLGYAAWPAATPADASSAPGRQGRGRSSGAPADVDEPAGVDIWHWQDTTVMAKQKLDANTDRRRNMLAVWHVDSGTLVPIGKSYTETVTPIRHTNLAYVAEWAAYAMDRSIGRPAADLYVADLTTGARTKLKDTVNDRGAQVSPGGKYLLYLQDDQFWTINLGTRAVTNITKSAPTSFIDKESDETIKQKPPFGVAGWTTGDGAVVLYDKYDLWQVAADGSGAKRLTNGAAEEVRHRYVRVNPADEAIDLTKPIYVSLFGVWSKKSGYGEVAPGSGQATKLLFLDKGVSGLAKARHADVYSYVAQDYDDSPDLFVAGPDLKSGRQVTATNPFQANYAWGKSEIVEYKTDKGLRLQGALYYPAGYEAGKRYPMIVYMYERLSDSVHSYVAPSDTSYYNTSVFTSQGYFVFQPDIAFRPRQPGFSVVECVVAGVKKVTSMGAVDPARVGVIGHSWGGFDSAFIATHTNGVFAAAVAGAPITDLVSNYGNHHWSSGIAETDHIETGQQRMEVPLYEDLQDYIANSAVFNVQNMTVPLLLECGDADGTVFWHQSVELYNIARRAKKNVVMLVYNGEDHGLRQRKNMVDYQHRILEWFGTYLKRDEAPQWITHGESFLDRADEVKKLSAKRGQ
ncbi:MAG TPA: prolyl oligopeptidase family serine peptidase [Vicinamibacterales bacterium]|nr:prolyl oligopeptidase family serine peptidase [Vicinamibacterales bacterium]